MLAREIERAPVEQRGAARAGRVVRVVDPAAARCARGSATGARPGRGGSRVAGSAAPGRARRPRSAPRSRRPGRPDRGSASRAAPRADRSPPGGSSRPLPSSRWQGSTCRSGSTRTPWRRSIQPAIAAAKLGRARGRRIAAPLRHRSEQRLADQRRGLLVRVPDREVDQLDPAGPGLRLGLVQPHEGVGREGVEGGVSGSSHRQGFLSSAVPGRSRGGSREGPRGSVRPAPPRPIPRACAPLRAPPAPS